MSSSYDNKISLSREQEGSYHRREVEYPGSSSSRACEEPKTYTTTSYKVVVPPKSRSDKKKGASRKGAGSSSDEDDTNFEEWTTTKRKVNHKTRQVETRVSRQLLLEDGKLIADSGPQVVTRIKEDNKVEECEKEKAPKNKGKFEALESAPEGESNGRVLGEKREIQRTSREVREENMQYHDERYQELTGRDMHQRAIKSPHELITINDQEQDFSSKPRGKMVHYSNRGKKYEDTDEILEVAKLAIDGSITKEITRKKHHEEFSEDELPDEKGEAEALRHKPIHEKSSRTNVDYVNDFDETSEPESERESRRRHRDHQYQEREERAFPKYEIDPLLSQLHDKDRQAAETSNSRYREHRLRRRSSSSSSASSQERDVRGPHQASWRPSSQQQQHHYQPQGAERFDHVPVPEEYRINRERLLRGKGTGKNRSQSPAASKLSSVTGDSHRTRSHRRGHRDDASVQARLTDEEEERRSATSGSDRNSHRRAAKQLERQSTINSQRHYHYGGNGEGQRRRQKSPAESVKSFTSSASSASSVGKAKDRLREQGARSRDSGFKSPISEQQQQQQIYSVSRKAKKGNRDAYERELEREGLASPTPTTGSVGQRSVKTTTTTLSAGLADRDRPVKPERRHGSARQSATLTSPARSPRRRSEKVSKPPSPFQKLAQLFTPSSQKKREATAAK